VPIQAAIGSRVDCRGKPLPRCAKTFWPSATAATFRANASSSKNKKKASRRMKRVGQVDIPQEAFLAVLKVSSAEEED